MINHLRLLNDNSRFPALDGLRGVAVLLVFMRHGVNDIPDSNEMPLHSLFQNGWIGVDIFFILSGFLITVILFEQLENQPTRRVVQQFYLRRILRIFPAYFFIITLIWFKLVPNYEPSHDLALNDLAQHILFIQEYNYSKILITLWSISVEVKFYIIAPLIVYLISTSKTYLNSCMIIAIVITTTQIIKWIAPIETNTYGQYFWEYRAPFQYSITPILLGVMAGILLHKKKHYILPNIAVNILFLILIVLLNFKPWANKHATAELEIFYILALLLISVLFINILSNKCTLAKLLTFTPLRQLGKLSYAIYLTHFLIIPSIIKVSSEQNTLIIHWTSYIIYTLISSLLLHFVIEKPFLKLKLKI